VLQEIKIGKPRREALKDLAKRLEVDDLSNFIGAVVQADQLGVSMCNMLRLQSQSIRQKRRQRIEEQAMKAPVKMLLPLVLFIFPCIFIVLLGPAVLQFIAAMGGR
jgi:tight adherence protein C